MDLSFMEKSKDVCGTAARTDKNKNCRGRKAWSRELQLANEILMPARVQTVHIPESEPANCTFC